MMVLANVKPPNTNGAIMTTKTDEQERVDFEAWWVKEGQYCRAGGGDYEKTFAYRAYQAGRASLQSQKPEPNNLMLSAVIRMPFEMAMADPISRMQFYQRAQQALDELEAMQSQDQEDAAHAEWMVDDGRAPWAINSLKDRIKEMRASEKRCRNAFRKDYMRVVSVYFADALGEAAEALEKRLSVIDHARRIEGGAKP